MKYELENIKMKEIGLRIKKERQFIGYTQDKLGEYLGVSRWTIADWEQGKDLPSIKRISDLCNLYECDIDYLLCHQSKKSKVQSDIYNVTGLTNNAINFLSVNKENQIYNPIDEPINAFDTGIEKKELQDYETFSYGLSYVLTEYPEIINELCQIMLNEKLELSTSGYKYKYKNRSDLRVYDLDTACINLSLKLRHFVKYKGKPYNINNSEKYSFLAQFIEKKMNQLENEVGYLSNQLQEYQYDEKNYNV